MQRDMARAMPRLTPFHPRTAALCRSYAWKEWAGYVAVSNYDRHSEREYFAIRHTAGLLDVTPLYKLDVTGPDAARLLALLWSRDITRLPVGRVVYGVMIDAEGFTLDDGTVARLGPRHFRATTSESWLGWAMRHARRMDLTIEDTTERVGALALQGPAARTILSQVTDIDLDALRFFGLRHGELAGRPVQISRTGYTGDLGYEIWTDTDHALPVWDAIMDAGRVHGIEPIGLDALDVSRLEAGFVLQGVDYISARACLINARRSTPSDAGLAWTVKLDRAPFIGQAAMRAELARGPVWDLVGLELSVPHIEALYRRVGLPPALAPVACRSAVPVYEAAGRIQVGQVTSSVWSPLLKKYIALAQIRRPHTAEGARLMVEYTVEFERQRVEATVVPRPFFDPPRKRHTPKAPRKAPREKAPKQGSTE